MRHVIVLGSAAAVHAFRQRGGATSISPDQVHYVTDLRTADLLGAVQLRGGDVLLFLDNGAATEAVWAVRSRKVYDVGNPLEIYLQGDPLAGGPTVEQSALIDRAHREVLLDELVASISATAEHMDALLHLVRYFDRKP